MAQPQMVPIYCNECNGRYDSEHELWEHMNRAHRRFVSEQNTFPDGDIQPNSVEDRFGMLQKQWAKLSVQLRNRVHARFNSEELAVIDRFILLASQSSIFNDVCR
jgi:hypothetical protein